MTTVRIMYFAYYEVRHTCLTMHVLYIQCFAMSASHNYCFVITACSYTCFALYAKSTTCFALCSASHNVYCGHNAHHHMFLHCTPQELVALPYLTRYTACVCNACMPHHIPCVHAPLGTLRACSLGRTHGAGPLCSNQQRWQREAGIACTELVPATHG